MATKSYNKGNLSASYGGTTGFKANSTAKNGIVSLSLRNAKLTVTAVPSSVKQYDTIVFTAKVVDSATGKAISDNSKAVAVFKINGKTVLSGFNSTNGKIDLSFITTLRPGMYELLIISGENGIYKAGKVTTVLKIKQK